MRAQAAVEAMVYIGLFLFITVFFSIILLNQQAQDLRSRQYRLGSEIAGQIADAIELAALAGPGFNANFTLPPSVLGRQYSANLTTSGSLYITVLGDSSFFGGSDNRFYYPLGRGNFDVNTSIPGNGKEINNYQGAGGLLYRAFWFNTSRGYVVISVAPDRTIVFS